MRSKNSDIPSTPSGKTMRIWWIGWPKSFARASIAPSCDLRLVQSAGRFSKVVLTKQGGTGFCSELEQQRREERAVALLHAGDRPVLVVVNIGEAQLRTRGHLRRQPGIEVVERVGEVARLPDARQLLRHLARRGQGPVEVLARFQRAAARASGDAVALDDGADRSVDGEVSGVAAQDAVAAADERRDEVVDVLEGIAEVGDLAERKSAVGEG